MISEQAHNPIPAGGSSDCPTPSLLLGYADRTLQRDQARLVRAHLVQCDACTELLGLMAAAPAEHAQELSRSRRREDQKLVAGRLGFHQPPPLPWRLLALADALWCVRTPALVPVGVAALLLFMLIPATRQADRPVSTPLVYQFSEVVELTTTDQALRSAPATSPRYRATTGSLIFLRHHASRSGLAGGVSVTLTVTGEAEQERRLLATASERGLIEIPLTIKRPGTYRLQLSRSDSGEILTALTCQVAPTPPAH